MMSEPDRGFTLVELLVSIVILAVITGPIATAIIISLRTTTEAGSRLERSQDVELATSTFASDVQSAAVVKAGAGSPACGSAPLLSFEWSDLGLTPAVGHVISYTLAGAGAAKELVRHHCESGVDSARTLAHNVASVSAPVCESPLGGAVSCPTSASSPETVTLTLTDTAGATFALRGTRRPT